MTGAELAFGQPLAGRRVALRPLDRRRLAELHALLGAGDPRAWPLRGALPSLDELEEQLWGASRVQYALVARGDDRTVGLVQGLDEDLRSGTVAVGIAVGEELWRAGWPLEGLVLFLNLLIAGHGYRKLTLEVPAHGVDRFVGSSHRWLEDEGHLAAHAVTEHGVEDVAFFSLFARDWDRDLALQVTGNARAGAGGTS
ncbi:MAG TPA: hypothetical protein VEW93_02400 [Acidimicrobiales bacterium]|nr:hypothetical protein [Acidimicrobiales bacterium]